MKQFVLLCVAVVVAYAGLTFAFAQEKAAPEAITQYRVMSLADMFKDDEAAMKKVKEMVVNISINGRPANGIRRTDMDAADYEKVLNQISDDGWELVSVTPANYWVFQKKH